MRIFLLIIFIFFVMAVFQARSVFANKKDVYRNLRRQAFQTTEALFEEFEFGPRHQTYGVIMDWRSEGTPVTLICFVSGDASLYWSPGGGMIGGSGIPAVRDAAVRAVRFADEVVDNMTRADDMMLPDQGITAIYVLTTEGRHTIRVKEEELLEDHHPVLPLYAAMQDVITEFRLYEEQHKEQEREGPGAGQNQRQ